MIPLTEADLLRMRAIQAKATPGPWRVGWTRWWRGLDGSEGKYVWTGTEGDFERDPMTPHVEFFGRDVAENASLVESARTDWPRLTEWALEARRLLATILDTPAVKRLDFEDGSPWIRTQVNEAWIQEARRLLGES